MRRLAIVGGGIAGLSLAYHLRHSFDITIYERNDYMGGHANTVEVAEQGKEIPIDTGFMVFNHATYPNLLDLFDELRVPTVKTDMSFSVQRPDIELEYSGASFNRLFGNRKNILSGRFWHLLIEIDRFNKEAERAADDEQLESLSLQDYIQGGGYSEYFLHSYLIPMSGAIWSTPPEKMLRFPAITLIRFFKNHGLLGVKTQHQWWTVAGGSKQYVQRLLAAMPSVSRLHKQVLKVVRTARQVMLTTCDGSAAAYDLVAFACHADEALSLLGEPRDDERRLLSAFRYQRNNTILHTDASVMPGQRRCWASWNYRLDGHGASTHYWMNSLQNVSSQTNYFVTLNGEHLIDKDKIIKRMVYHHPLFDVAALQAQSELTRLNENSYREQIFYCGSYFGYGFHEDALNSSLKLAELIAGRVPCH